MKLANGHNIQVMPLGVDLLDVEIADAAWSRLLHAVVREASGKWTAQIDPGSPVDAGVITARTCDGLMNRLCVLAADMDPVF